MNRWMVMLYPRVAGPFSRVERYTCGPLPRFEGGAVILAEPRYINPEDGVEELTVAEFVAYPLDVVGMVTVSRHVGSSGEAHPVG